MFGSLNFLFPSRAQSVPQKSACALSPEKNLAQTVLDNQRQILTALQALKQDQVELHKATQATLSRQHQDYLSHFWALSNAQSHLQNIQSRMFSDQRVMVQQLETMKNRLTLPQR
jgi:hypothetical protein